MQNLFIVELHSTLANSSALEAALEEDDDDALTFTTDIA